MPFSGVCSRNRHPQAPFEIECSTSKPLGGLCFMPSKSDLFNEDEPYADVAPIGDTFRDAQ
jgi:hypothetical protein